MPKEGKPKAPVHSLIVCGSCLYWYARYIEIQNTKTNILFKMKTNIEISNVFSTYPQMCIYSIWISVDHINISARHFEDKKSCLLPVWKIRGVFPIIYFYLFIYICGYLCFIDTSGHGNKTFVMATHSDQLDLLWFLFNTLLKALIDILFT